MKLLAVNFILYSLCLEKAFAQKHSNIFTRYLWIIDVKYFRMYHYLKFLLFYLCPNRIPSKILNYKILAEKKKFIFTEGKFRAKGKNYTVFLILILGLRRNAGKFWKDISHSPEQRCWGMSPLLVQTQYNQWKKPSEVVELGTWTLKQMK